MFHIPHWLWTWFWLNVIAGALYSGYRMIFAKPFKDGGAVPEDVEVHSMQRTCPNCGVHYHKSWGYLCPNCSGAD